MKIDVLGLQAFTAVVDEGSFGKAAQVLHISQTALSHRLKALESQLQARLIDRTTRSWKLTQIGERFYPRAKRLVEELRASFSDIREAAERGVTLTTIACTAMTASEMIPHAVLEYSRAFPHSRVRILEMRSPEVMEAVAQGRAEFGICAFGRAHPDIDAEAVRDEPYVLICRSDHVLSTRRRVQWADIDGEPVVAMMNTANGTLNTIFTKLSFDVKMLHEVQRSTTALALVSAGLGVAILPKLALHSGIYQNLRAVSLAGPVLKREVLMVKRKGVALHASAEPLYKFIRQALQTDRE